MNARIRYYLNIVTTPIPPLFLWQHYYSFGQQYFHRTSVQSILPTPPFLFPYYIPCYYHQVTKKNSQNTTWFFLMVFLIELLMHLQVHWIVILRLWRKILWLYSAYVKWRYSLAWIEVWQPCQEEAATKYI